ncbi:type II secretion system protein GspG [Verrucomicrobiaceae bacterium 227]
MPSNKLDHAKSSRRAVLIKFVAGSMFALGSGVVIAASYFSGARHTHSGNDIADQTMGSLETNLENYKNIGGNYPSQSQGLEALIAKPTSAPQPRRWTQTLDSDKLLYDPWGTKLEYHYPGKQDPTRPEIASAGPDKTFGTEDDQSSQDGI